MSNEGVREAVSEPEATGSPLVRKSQGANFQPSPWSMSGDPVATAPGSDLFGFADFCASLVGRDYFESNIVLGHKATN